MALIVSSRPRLVGDLVGIPDARFAKLADGGFEFGVSLGRHEFRLGFSGARGEVLDRRDQFADFAESEFEGGSEIGLGNFVTPAFDHNHIVLRGGDDQVDVRVVEIGHGGVNDELPVDPADPRTGNGACNGNVGQRQGACRAADAENVGIVLLIGRENDHVDLHLVFVSLREKRANRAVDHARGKGLLFGGTSFAFEEPAGDLSGGVGLFAVVHLQGEESPVRRWFFGGDDGHEDHCVAVTDGHGPVGLTCEVAGFDGKRPAAEFKFDTFHSKYASAMAT